MWRWHVTMEISERLLTPGEVALMFRVDPKTVTRWASAGRIGSIAGMLWLIPPFHMYRQLKGAYALSTGGALWRASLLTIFALIVVSLFAALLVGVGMFE